MQLYVFKGLNIGITMWCWNDNGEKNGSKGIEIDFKFIKIEIVVTSLLTDKKLCRSIEHCHKGWGVRPESRNGESQSGVNAG